MAHAIDCVHWYNFVIEWVYLHKQKGLFSLFFTSGSSCPRRVWTHWSSFFHEWVTLLDFPNLFITGKAINLIFEGRHLSFLTLVLRVDLSISPRFDSVSSRYSFRGLADRCALCLTSLCVFGCVVKAKSEVLIKKWSKTDYKTICFNCGNHRRRCFEVSGSRRK